LHFSYCEENNDDVPVIFCLSFLLKKKKDNSSFLFFCCFEEDGNDIVIMPSLSSSIAFQARKNDGEHLVIMLWSCKSERTMTNVTHYGSAMVLHMRKNDNECCLSSFCYGLASEKKR